jgi:ABC-type transport system involved in cytochrome bd biosynthesis fused ATPase/permease subunit
MERNPIRYVLARSRGIHGLALLLVALSLPVLWLLIAVPRALMDDVFLGRAFPTGTELASFLRIVLPLPWQLGGERVLFAGIPLPRDLYFIAGAMLVGGLVIARALLRVGLRLLSARLGPRLADDLRLALFRQLIGERGASDDVENAIASLGHRVAAVTPFLGRALVTPVLSIAEAAIPVLFVLTLNLWLGLALAAAGILDALLVPARENEREEAGRRLAAGEREATQMAHRTVDRLPAIRVHGTADREAGHFAERLTVLARKNRPSLRQLTWLGFVLRTLRDGMPALMLILAGWFVMHGALTPGGLVAAVTAAFLVIRPVEALALWTRERHAAVETFDEIARSIGEMKSRARRHAEAALPEGWRSLKAAHLSVFDPATSHRLSAIDLELPLPGHAALVTDGDGGGHILAAAIGGALDASAGEVLIDGVNLAHVPPAVRARRIALAGVTPILFDGTLRQNLLYGASLAEGDDTDRLLCDALRIAGIDDDAYTLGLATSVDGQNAPKLAARVVEVRRAVRAELVAGGMEDLVDPFEPNRYNRHGTVAENILQGVPVGDTFHEEHLATNPFLRAVLEAEDLTRPLAEMGFAIAESLVEIFEGVPDGHPLFQRFAFFSAAERGFCADMVARRAERRRGAESGRDRDRQIALALRYVETRHRLGVLDAEMERRLVQARHTFARLLPSSLKPAITFYEPNEICAAASLSDNLLFGRIAYDVAGAEEKVHAVVRRVLTALALDDEVLRLGLSAHLSHGNERLQPVSPVLIDLARCLVRQPELLVVDHVFEGLSVTEAVALMERLSTVMTGRGLIAVVPPGFDTSRFDRVVRFEGDKLLVEDPSEPGNTSVETVAVENSAAAGSA